MNRIDRTFAALRAAGRKGFVGFLTAGDPDAAESLARVRTAIAGGIDVLELGIPFSDPTADGPVIQAASLRALAAGMTVAATLDLCRRIRAESEVPIVLFGYVNPIFRYGYARFCADAKAAGADGLLIVDLPFEEWGELLPHARAQGLHMIPLIAPTTPDARAARILADAGGFVYYIMVTGVTGMRAQLVADLAAQVGRLKALTSLPIAAGFGVGSGAQAREVAACADAVVVGSALIKAAQEGRLAALAQEIRGKLEA